MALKNPLGRLADTAINTLKHPRETAGKVVEQARDTATFGRMVAEQVSKSAVSKATETIGRASGRGASGTAATELRPVPDVNEPAHTVDEPVAEVSTESTKRHGDPLKQAAVTKSTAKKAPAKKSAAKKSAARKAPAKKVTATPNDVAEVVESAVAEDPTKTAATPAKKTSKKAPAAKSAPGDKLPTKKSAKAPAKKTTKRTPKTAEQVATGEGAGVVSPAGTSAAGAGRNPDTAEGDLNQPGTEGIVEESTAKAIASETETLRKAAEKNPE